MKVPRDEPDYEADSVSIVANTITKIKGKFRRTGDHNAQKMSAEGDVKITVNKQHPGKENSRRPPVGTVLHFPGQKDSVEITARRIEKHSQNGGGRDTATASKGVWIFRKRRLLK